MAAGCGRGINRSGRLQDAVQEVRMSLCRGINVVLVVVGISTLMFRLLHA